MAKKKKKPTVQPLSPKKYITSRARTLPLHKCFINSSWDMGGMANIIVSRKHVNGNITAGIYLVDLIKRGVLDTTFRFNMSASEFDDLVDDVAIELIEEVPYNLVHNIIYAALELAEENDLTPHKDFSVTEFILEVDDDNIELIDIPLGAGAFLVPDEVDEDHWIDETYDWDDQEWYDFFASAPELSFIELTQLADSFFAKYLEENYPEKEAMEVLVSEDDFNLTIEPFTADFKNKEEIETSEQFHQRMINAEPYMVKQLEKELRSMIEKNPSNPIYHNYLGTLAQIENDDIKFRRITEETVQQFPDYLYGKLTLANFYLNGGKTEEVENLFHSIFDLKMMYPDKKVFHVYDFISFYSIVFRYHIQKKDYLKAELLSEILADVIHNWDIDWDSNQLYFFHFADNDFTKMKFELIQGFFKSRELTYK